MEEDNSSFTLCEIAQPILTNEIARYKPHAGFNETFFFQNQYFSFPGFVFYLQKNKRTGNSGVTFTHLAPSIWESQPSSDG